MRTDQFGRNTTFDGFDEFQDAFLTDRGQILIIRFDFQLLAPPSWSPKKIDAELGFWEPMCDSRFKGLHPEFKRLLARCLSVSAVAELLKMPESRALQMTKNGSFGAIRVHQIWRIYRKSIQKVLAG